MQGPSGSLSSFAFLTLKGQLSKVPRAFLCLAFQGQRQASGFFINDRVALCLVMSCSFQKSAHRSQNHLWPWEFLFRSWPGLNVTHWLFLTLFRSYLALASILSSPHPVPTFPLFLFPSSCSWSGLSFYFHVLWVMGSLDKIRSLCCLLLLMAFPWQFTAKLLASSLHEFQAPSHCSF